jgi:hypothetical protein
MIYSFIYVNVFLFYVFNFGKYFIQQNELLLEYKIFILEMVIII